jgi:NADH:ubiquinone oxidoreductase subunit K
MTMSFPNSLSIVFVIFFIGLYCLITQRSLVKMVIGIEILAKAVTLNLIWAGYFQNRAYLGQALAIIVIAIDAVVVALLMSLIVLAHKHYDSVDIENITRLKG